MEILGYGSRDAYLEADPTIAAKAKDMVGHYLTLIFPNGYKAQIVATSREAAVRYKRHVDAALAAGLAAVWLAVQAERKLSALALGGLGRSDQRRHPDGRGQRQQAVRTGHWCALRRRLRS